MRMTPPGDKNGYRKEIGIILVAFVLSRVLAAIFGIHLKYEVLFIYWQYLDTETLRHHLLQGLWYDHAQPPFFNLLLGLVLKNSGNYAPAIFSALLRIISLTNCLLLFAILKRLVQHPYIPLLITLVYLLSPSLIIFESELFYTTFISMLLLISAFYLLRLQAIDPQTAPADPRTQTTGPRTQSNSPWKYVAGVCLPLIIMCLTRSMYHILWLTAISVFLLVRLKKSSAFRPLFAGLVISLLLVT